MKGGLFHLGWVKMGQSRVKLARSKQTVNASPRLSGFWEQHALVLRGMKKCLWQDKRGSIDCRVKYLGTLVNECQDFENVHFSIVEFYVDFQGNQSHNIIISNFGIGPIFSFGQLHKVL